MPARGLRYVAFLRAINVGGHTVKMDRLRALFEKLKLRNVETFIASGNVLFDAPAGNESVLEGKIERHLQAALGYDVMTFVRSGAELASIVAFEPFEDAGKHSLFVTFLKCAPDPAMRKKILDLRNPSDDFTIRGKEVYWLSRAGFSGSKAAVPLGKICAAGTARNVTTVRKLAAKTAPS